MSHRLQPGLHRRLEREIRGEVMFDAFTRGRYATDASIYQVMPAGVVVPSHVEDIEAALSAARDEGVPLTMRGGGTSQCGQTVNSGLIVDTSRHLNRIIELDVEGRRAIVEPGIVLAELNRQLEPYGLWFPVDISTATRATIGGMAANNACGARSLRYGTMRDNTLSIDAILADGTRGHFGILQQGASNGIPRGLAEDLLSIGRREADEINRRFPKVQRRVGGYNLDAILPEADPINLAHILVGSEGTLGISAAIEIRLWPLPPKQKVLGACHFPTFRAAMDAARHIVKLDPTSVELIDATMIELARGIAMYRPTLERFLRGNPAAILLVEFADMPDENERKAEALVATMSDLGFEFGRGGENEGGVVQINDAGLQAAIAELRAGGLNIMMSMKEEGKPVSFVEDCAVPLEHLADYTDRLTEIFERHGTRGTWYAHASVGCLHVRPVLNMKLEKDAGTMRAIAEEAFAMVREYKGSHSGEHGDGIVRSEFHEAMFGSRIARSFEEIKDRFDPGGVLNPGKIVGPPKMNDRALFRYSPDYAFEDIRTGFDWSEWTGKSGGLQGAVEMCNNNGACRKLAGGVMCPSYRVTRNELDVTRGRANTLRLALSGQLGADALHSDDMAETLKLCVSCKACRRECPTGVDMARMKAEVLHQRAKKAGVGARLRLIAELPRIAPALWRLGDLTALRDKWKPAAALTETFLGFARERSFPRFSPAPFRDHEADFRGGGSGKVVLLADTFGRWFEPETLRAAVSIFKAAEYDLETARPADGTSRPLCCGRTYLAAGMIDRAREEAQRTLAALLPSVDEGATVIGLEPSCILTLRDEFLALIPGEDAVRLSRRAMLAEEFLATEAEAGRLKLDLAPSAGKALLHGHCHQKAFGAMGAVERALSLIPGLEIETVESSCCGMAGAFGFDAETIAISKAMGEMSLLPAVRQADPDTLIVADGTSCRHQIADCTPRRARHVVEVLAEALQDSR
jgi:FAD/FMN-containing dehydrogenase/Fe-S oxidoreductase